MPYQNKSRKSKKTQSKKHITKRPKMESGHERSSKSKAAKEIYYKGELQYRRAGNDCFRWELKGVYIVKGAPFNSTLSFHYQSDIREDVADDFRWHKLRVNPKKFCTYLIRNFDGHFLKIVDNTDPEKRKQHVKDHFELDFTVNNVNNDVNNEFLDVVGHGSNVGGSYSITGKYDLTLNQLFLTKRFDTEEAHDKACDSIQLNSMFAKIDGRHVMRCTLNQEPEQNQYKQLFHTDHNYGLQKKNCKMALAPFSLPRIQRMSNITCSTSDIVKTMHTKHFSRFGSELQSIELLDAFRQKKGALVSASSKQPFCLMDKDLVFPVCHSGYNRSQVLYALMKDHDVLVAQPHGCFHGFDPQKCYTEDTLYFPTLVSDTCEQTKMEQKAFFQGLGVLRQKKFGFEKCSNGYDLVDCYSDNGVNPAVIKARNKMVQHFNDVFYGAAGTINTDLVKRKIYVCFNLAVGSVIQRLVEQGIALNNVVVVAMQFDDTTSQINNDEALLPQHYRNMYKSYSECFVID